MLIKNPRCLYHNLFTICSY